MKDSLISLVKAQKFDEIKKAINDNKVTLKDLNETNQEGNRAEHLLAEAGQKEILELLEIKFQIITKSKFLTGKLPVHCAAAAGHLEIVQLYSKLNMACLFASDRKVGGLAHFVARANKSEIMSWLCLYYSTLLQMSNFEQKQLPLDTAIEYGSIDVIRVLLANNYPLTEDSLIAAIRGGKKEYIGDIVQRTGIKLNIKHMCIAARYGKIDIMRLFNENGIPYQDDTNKENQSPMQVAAINRQWDTVEFLHSQKIEPFANSDLCHLHFMQIIQDSLDAFVDKKDPETVVMLLKAILNPNSPADHLYSERLSFDLKSVLLEDERMRWDFSNGQPNYLIDNNVLDNSYLDVDPKTSNYTVIKSSLDRTTGVIIQKGEIAAALCIELKKLLKEWTFKEKHAPMTQNLADAALKLREHDEKVLRSTVGIWKQYAQRSKLKKFKEALYKEHATLLHTKKTFQNEIKPHETIHPQVVNQIQQTIQQIDATCNDKLQLLNNTRIYQLASNTLVHWHSKVYRSQAKERTQAYKGFEEAVKRARRPG